MASREDFPLELTSATVRRSADATVNGVTPSKRSIGFDRLDDAKPLPIGKSLDCLALNVRADERVARSTSDAADPDV
jgi:hypothetical protein